MFEAKGTKAALTKTIEAALSKTFTYRVERSSSCRRRISRSSWRRRRKRFGKQPTKYRYDVLFVKPRSPRVPALPEVDTTPGVDEVWAGKHALYFRRLVAQASRTSCRRSSANRSTGELTIRNWNATMALARLSRGQQGTGRRDAGRTKEGMASRDLWTSRRTQRSGSSAKAGSWRAVAASTASRASTSWSGRGQQHSLILTEAMTNVDDRARLPREGGRLDERSTLRHETRQRRRIDKPTRSPPQAASQKRIDEYVGRVNNGRTRVASHMRSPSGWVEPGQRPEFDRYTVVLRGELRVDDGGAMDIAAGQARCSPKAGRWIRYSSPGGRRRGYIAVCLPAFSPDTVHRDPS